MVEGSENIEEILSLSNIPLVIVDDKDSVRFVFGIEKHRASELLSEDNFISIYYQDFYIGKLYYGYPRSLSYLSLLPYLVLLILVPTFIITALLVRNTIAYERERFWNIFSKGLAHQLGVPVMTLTAKLQKLFYMYDVDEEHVKEVERILSRIESILKRFSKIGSQLKLENVSIREIVSIAYENFRHKLDLEVSGDCTVLGDRELLSWVFENLFKNAYEAEASRIKVSILSKDNSCEVIFEDDGRGISESILPYLFKTNKTTKSKGWGIGLLLSRRILELHGANIEVVSSKPATFLITFRKR